jgi:membrane protease YdiL (CAAX protease family)
MGTLDKVIVGSVPVIAVLVAAAFFVPPDFPMLWRQVLLALWGVGGILIADRLFFSPDWGRALAAIGFVAPRWRAVAVALIVSLPMWLFLPLYSMATGTLVGIRPEWLSILVGVILVNGLAEESIHRGFIFGHLRKERSFFAAAVIGAAIFAAQHLYIIFSVGPVPGISSVLLAVFLTFPLAFLFERGGNSLAGPTILHTSSNAPIMLFALPPEAMSSILLPHMAVVLVSMYLSFAFGGWLGEPASQPARDAT